MKTDEKKAVVIQVPGELAKQAEGLYAWIVDKKGNIVEKAVLKGGKVTLKTEAGMFHGQAKVYIAPDFSGAGVRVKVSERLLQKAGAYQPPARLKEGFLLELGRLPDISRFRFRLCNITGMVTKTFTIDGVSQVWPVCNVRVHICEVDPLKIVLPRIPDRDIFDLRDRILEVIIKEKFPPDPIPDPWPDPIGPYPRVFKAATGRILRQERLEMKSLALPVLDDEVISGLSSPSAGVIRDILNVHYFQLRPYLCLFPKRWPWLYRCDEIATVYPDCNGRFDYLYFYFEHGDHPDIYIWVEANIGGSWETVYKPSKACGTHWNYVCGSDLNVRITDPRVHPCECGAIPGQVVWIKRVNDGVSVRNIRQDSSGSAHLANAIGLTQYGGGDYVSPFGNAFPLVVQFGSGFPSAGATHYRWKYRQLKNATLSNVADPLHIFDGAVYKPYTYERVNSDGDTVFYTGSFQLGPFPSPSGAIFRIPHAEASVDIPAEPTAEWNQDTYSVNVNSLNLNDGLYEFVFELLDVNGNVIPLDKDVFVVDKKAEEVSNPPDAPTISAFGRPENYLLQNGAGKAIGFRFVMRLDNDVCYADIKDALVDGSPTHTECGFGQYLNKATSQVTLRFEASHPQDFAIYGFYVVKGNGNPAGPTNTGGYVTQAHDGYSVSGDNFSKNVAVSDMLGVCDKAAFAENLYLWATHTNGNRRLDEYDRHDTAAFAIEPKLPTLEP